MRNILMLIIIVALSFISACQKEDYPLNTKIEKVPSAKLRVALNFRENPARYFQIRDKVERFTQKYPQVEVEGVRIPEEIEGYNTLIRDIHSLPDIIELNPNQVGLSLKDRLESLSPYMNKEIEKSSLYSEEEQSLWSGTYAKLIDTAKIDGEMYMIPVRSDSATIVYNKALFNEFGIPDPSEGWSWEEFLEASQKLRNHNYFTYVPPMLETLEPIIIGHGGSYSSEDLTDFTGFLDSEETIAAFKRFSQESFYDEASLKAKTFEMSIHLPGALSNTSSLLLKQENYSIAPFPTFKEGESMNTAYITGLTMSKSSEYKETAWELMKFIVGETDEDALQFVATNTLEFFDDRFHKEPHFKQDMMIERLINEMSHAVPSTLYMSTGTLEYQYSPNFWNNKDFENVIEGNDVESSLARSAKEMEGKLSTVYEKP